MRGDSEKQRERIREMHVCDQSMVTLAEWRERGKLVECKVLEAEPLLFFCSPTEQGPWEMFKNTG